jgi:hypothetical protein
MTTSASPWQAQGTSTVRSTYYVERRSCTVRTVNFLSVTYRYLPLLTVTFVFVRYLPLLTVTGDGFADILVGAQQADPHGR